MKNAILIITLLLSCIVCAGNESAKEKKSSQEQSQCWAMTKSGNRCKRRARPNERYCKQHSASASSAKPPTRCRSMTESLTQCEEKPVEGKNYCQKHLGVKQDK